MVNFGNVMEAIYFPGGYVHVFRKYSSLKENKYFSQLGLTDWFFFFLKEEQCVVYEIGGKYLLSVKRNLDFVSTNLSSLHSNPLSCL